MKQEENKKKVLVKSLQGFPKFEKDTPKVMKKGSLPLKNKKSKL